MFSKADKKILQSNNIILYTHLYDITKNVYVLISIYRRTIT